MEKDACQICHGERGGVPGNENIVDGIVMCDYCHADTLPDPKPYCEIPCLICRRDLHNFDPPMNHPMRGLEFTTPGHYGSRLFDMDSGDLVVNICDDCLEIAAIEGRVLHREIHRPARPKATYRKWKRG